MNKVLEVILKLNDQFTAPLRGSEGGLKSFGSEMKNMLGGLVSLGGIAVGLNKAFEASDRFRVATQQLEGTAKITGVSLEWLKGIAEDAGKRFGLSKVQASDFAVEMAKLATKAGDVGAAGPALEAFLNIGAARGLTAAETLKAVQQSILGIDEGTDKLFNANPSVLYAMFADSIGTTAGKLTDQQKAQALLTAAMEDGSKVVGQYAAWLDTVAGKAAMAANASEEASAKLGDSLQMLRSGLADAKVFGAELLTGVVQMVQLAGEWIGAAFLMVPLEIKLLWTSLLTGVAAGVEELGKLIPFVGDKIEEAGRTMLAKHRASGQALMAQMEQYKQFHAEAQADILGIDITGAQNRFDAAKKGAKDRAKVNTDEAATAKATKEKSGKELDALEKLYAAQGLSTLQSQHLSYEQLVAAFQEKMKGMTVEDQQKAQAILDKHASRLLDIYNKNFSGMNAAVRGLKGPMDGLMTDFSALPAAAEPTLQFLPRMQKAAGELAPAFANAAQDIGAFADALGVSSPRLDAALTGVQSLSDAMSAFATGDFTQAFTSGLAGVTTILGGLFGDTPADKERKALLQKNNDALRDLARSNGLLLRAQSTGAKVAAAKEGLAGFEDIAKIVGTSAGINATRFQGFRGLLQSLGLTVGDAEQLAKDFGIDLGIENGGISQGAVQAFIQGLQTANFGKVGDTFADQTDFLDRYFKVAGIADPALQAAFIADAIKEDNAFLADLLKKYDFNTAEGRAGLQAEFVSIFQRLQNGTFDSALFGNLSGAEFVDFIESFTDLIGGIGSGFAGGAGIGGGSVTGASFSGVTFATASYDLGIVLFAPIARMDTNLAEAVSILRDIRAINISIGTINGGDPAAFKSAALDAINEALAAERDLSSAAEG